MAYGPPSSGHSPLSCNGMAEQYPENIGNDDMQIA